MAKTKNFLKIVFMVLLALALTGVCCLMSACGNKDAENETTTVEVSFNLNGATTGTVPSSMVLVKGQQSIVLFPNLSGVSKNDTAPLGWSTSATATTAQYLSNEIKTLSFESDTVFYAVWPASQGGTGDTGDDGDEPDLDTTQPINVTYSLSGGDGTAPSSLVISTDEERTVTVPTTTSFTKIGKIFAGWSLNSSATSVDVKPGQSFEATYNDITLYAVFADEVTITFDTNGSTTGSNVEVVVPKGVITAVTAPNSAELSVAGKFFRGWSNIKTATEALYYAGDVYYISADQNMTFYAVWSTTSPSNISFDANGGTGTIDSVIVTYQTDNKLTMPDASALTRDGYEFIGWSSSSTATSASYFPGDVVDCYSSKTYYAIWSNTKVVFDANGAVGTTPESISKAFITADSEYFTFPSADTLSVEGKTFLGWCTYSTFAGNRTIYCSGYKCDFFGQRDLAATYYAIFINNADVTYINFYYNDEVYKAVPTYLSYNYAMYLHLPVVTEDGFIYTGWCNGESDNKNSYIGDTCLNSTLNNKTYYAIKEAVKVSFDINGGTGIAPEAFYTCKEYSSNYNDYSNNLDDSGVIAPEGYYLYGWSTNKNGLSYDGYDLNVPSRVYPLCARDFYDNNRLSTDTVYYAVYVPLATLTFNANGGEGGYTVYYKKLDSNDHFRCYIGVPDSTQVSTSDGRVLLGWSPYNTGYNIHVSDSMIRSSRIDPFNATLYAVWDFEVTLEFELNGEISVAQPESMIVLNSGTKEITLPTLSSTTKTFLGWSDYYHSTSVTYAGGATLNFGPTSVLGVNLQYNVETGEYISKLYAVWQGYTPVRFSTDFNDIDDFTILIPSGTSTEIAFPTATQIIPQKYIDLGFTLSGWYTSPNTTETLSETISTSNSTTYYAIYNKNIIDLYYIFNGQNVLINELIVNKTSGHTEDDIAFPGEDELSDIYDILPEGYMLVGWSDYCYIHNVSGYNYDINLGQKYESRADSFVYHCLIVGEEKYLLSFASGCDDYEGDLPKTQLICASATNNTMKTIVPTCNITRTGFAFAGWTDGTKTYNPGDEIVLTSKLKLTAVWKGYVYTATYKDAEGNILEEVNVRAGETITFDSAKSGLQAPAYIINNIYYAGGYTYVMPTRNLTIVKTYKDEIKYTINFNNGETPTVVERSYFEGYTFKIENIERDGYSVNGYALSADGEVVYSLGDTVVVGSENTTYYVIWYEKVFITADNINDFQEIINNALMNTFDKTTGGFDSAIMTWSSVQYHSDSMSDINLSLASGESSYSGTFVSDGESQEGTDMFSAEFASLDDLYDNDGLFDIVEFSGWYSTIIEEQDNYENGVYEYYKLGNKYVLKFDVDEFVTDIVYEIANINGKDYIAYYLYSFNYVSDPYASKKMEMTSFVPAFAQDA